MSEKRGFKSRSLVSTIIDRLKTAAVPIEYLKVEPVDTGRIIQRWSSQMPDIWIFIDDIDRNFDGSTRDSLKVASFFDAIRAIVNEVDSVRFRCSIRPNTFVLLKRRFEGLSHIGQYVTDIRWSEHDFLILLGRRIEGYLKRTGQERILTQFSVDENDRSRELIKLVFESPIKWGSEGKVRPIHVPLFTLSQHRPRWLIELCRVSAITAFNKDHTKIESSDIFSELGEFGERRLHDTVAEFSPQCPQINEILDAFRSQVEQYTTAQLITLIRNRILNLLSPSLPSVIGKPSERDVASFLFQIGFIYARKDYEDGEYEHIGYPDQPSLLTSRTDMDSGCTWEIPPVYRQALNLRTVDGFERPVNKRENSSGGSKRPTRRIIR